MAIPSTETSSKPNGLGNSFMISLGISDNGGLNKKVTKNVFSSVFWDKHKIEFQR